MLNRRNMLAAMAGAGGLALLPSGAAAAAAKGKFVMWRDPGCGCCVAWAKRMEAEFGRALPIVESGNMAAVKQAQGVPADLQSCHTSLIDGLVVEGHVPAADIKRALAAGGIKGLAVPGMPAGSPGMDVGHDHKQAYQVIAFAADGRQSVFASHG